MVCTQIHLLHVFVYGWAAEQKNIGLGVSKLTGRRRGFYACHTRPHDGAALFMHNESTRARTSREIAINMQERLDYTRPVLQTDGQSKPPTRAQSQPTHNTLSGETGWAGSRVGVSNISQTAATQPRVRRIWEIENG